MSRLSLCLLLLFAVPVIAAEEPADAGSEEQTLEEVTGETESESGETSDASDTSEPAEPPKSRIRRPRKLGDIFKPSEEITADSAITFPADI